jgi:hypothetical protein
MPRRLKAFRLRQACPSHCGLCQWRCVGEAPLVLEQIQNRIEAIYFLKRQMFDSDLFRSSLGRIRDGLTGS